MLSMNIIHQNFPELLSYSFATGTVGPQKAAIARGSVMGFVNGWS